MDSFALMIAGIAIVIYLAFKILFILNIQNTFKVIAPHNRKMEPGMSWLLIIPIVETVWIFILSKRLGESIEAELTQRGIPSEKEPTYMLGLLYGIISIIAIVINVLNFSGSVSGFVNIITFVIFCIYWIQVEKYKKILKKPYAYPAAEKVG